MKLLALALGVCMMPTNPTYIGAKDTGGMFGARWFDVPYGRVVDGVGCWCETSVVGFNISSDALLVWGFGDEHGGHKEGMVVTLTARRIGGDPAIYFACHARDFVDGKCVNIQTGQALTEIPLGDDWAEYQWYFAKPFAGAMQVEFRALASGLSSARVEVDGVILE